MVVDCARYSVQSVIAMLLIVQGRTERSFFSLELSSALSIGNFSSRDSRRLSDHVDRSMSSHFILSSTYRMHVDLYAERASHLIGRGSR